MWVVAVNQKQVDNDTAVTLRGNSLYTHEEKIKERSSYENLVLKGVYDEFLLAPLSEKAKKYLHTTYHERKYSK